MTNWLDLLNEAKQNGGQQDFGPIPAGEYGFRVVEAVTGQTSTGKVKYTLKSQVQSGPHSGRLVWDDLIVSPDSNAAMGFFFRKMKALGLDENFWATGPSDDQITGALTGRDFLGKVIIDNFGNKDRNRIDGYKPLAVVSEGFVPPTPQAASGYAAPAPQQAAMPPQTAPAPAPQQSAPAPAPQQAAPAPAPGGDPWTAAPSAAPAPAPQQATGFPAPPF